MKNNDLSTEWSRRVKAVPKACWRNSVKVIRWLKDPGSSYVEGFVRLDYLGHIVVEHGWVELSDGTIIDPTIPDKDVTYFPGVRYSREEVLGKKQSEPPFVWGGKHGWGGFGHPEYRKAHEKAWGAEAMKAFGQVKEDAAITCPDDMFAMAKGAFFEEGGNQKHSFTPSHWVDLKFDLHLGGAPWEDVRKRVNSDVIRKKFLLAYDPIIISSFYLDFVRLTEVDFVTQDGRPYDITALESRLVSRSLGDSMPARSEIDRVFESPYYRLRPSQQNLAWGQANNVEIRSTPHIKTLKLEYPSLGRLLGDVKFTSCDPGSWEDTEAFLAMREPNETAYYVKHYKNGHHQGTHMVLVTPEELQKLERRNLEGHSIRVKNEL